jgi:hypothetical protein
MFASKHLARLDATPWQKIGVAISRTPGVMSKLVTALFASLSEVMFYLYSKISCCHLKRNKELIIYFVDSIFTLFSFMNIL